jgi:hypothetical protein
LNWRPVVSGDVNADRLQVAAVAVMAACAGLLVALMGWGLVVSDPTGLERTAYVLVGVANLVATAVGALVLRGRLTGTDGVDESAARVGMALCLISGSLLPNVATSVDGSDWRLLLFSLGTLLAAAGVVAAAIALRPLATRSRYGVDGLTPPGPTCRR